MTSQLQDTDVFVGPAPRVAGAVEVPGDKSISHRALLVALLSERLVRIEQLAPGDDVRSTLDAVRVLGAHVSDDASDPSTITVTGVGLRGLAGREARIDAGNAGTLARLLPGILAGQPGSDVTIVGDASLSRRPMDRVAVPLMALGVEVEVSPQGTLPLRVRGVETTHSGTWELDVASAQVQSMLLFASLFADGNSEVVEPAPIRDHTERMLSRAGAHVKRSGNTVRVSPAKSLQLPDTVVPRDPSAAAAFAAAALVLPGSLMRLPGVCANPGRFGFFDTVERMGARIALLGHRQVSGEPVVDIEIQQAPLARTVIDYDHVPSMIDELPLLALVAQFCKGPTVIRGAGELRHKESDRIATLVTALRRIGIAADERRDGIAVAGGGTRPEGGEIDAGGDHRMAMLGGIAGLVSRKGVTVRGADCVSVSYPGFFETLDALRG